MNYPTSEDKREYCECQRGLEFLHGTRHRMNTSGLQGFFRIEVAVYCWIIGNPVPTVRWKSAADLTPSTPSTRGSGVTAAIHGILPNRAESVDQKPETIEISSDRHHPWQFHHLKDRVFARNWGS